MGEPSSKVTYHTICILVRNESGVLARVIGLFSGRGYNIESLTVAEIETDGRDEGLSRITLVTKGSKGVVEQIKAQLERLVPVYRVDELLSNDSAQTQQGYFEENIEAGVECELALVKVDAVDSSVVQAAGGRLLDVLDGTAILELTGSRAKLDAILKKLRTEDTAHGFKDLTRTGIAALPRGPKTLGKN